MRRRWAAAVAALFVGTTSPLGRTALAADPAPTYWGVGFGTFSCAYYVAASQADWEKDAGMSDPGTQWILGYWSAMNALTSQYVGHRGAGFAIILAVRTWCEANPKSSITDAANVIYGAIRANGQ